MNEHQLGALYSVGKWGHEDEGDLLLPSTRPLHRLLPLPRTVFPPFFKQLASHHSGLNTNASFSENFSKLLTVSQSCNGVLLPW